MRIKTFNFTAINQVKQPKMNMTELSFFFLFFIVYNIRNRFEFNQDLAIEKNLWHQTNKSANQRSITIGYQLNGCLWLPITIVWFEKLG